MYHPVYPDFKDGMSPFIFKFVSVPNLFIIRVTKVQILTVYEVPNSVKWAPEEPSSGSCAEMGRTNTGYKWKSALCNLQKPIVCQYCKFYLI